MSQHRSYPEDIRRIDYDAVAYPARAFPATHPERLATALTLLGLQAPPVRNCRVLELGCATGGNLLPMAESLPEARFVGVEVSRNQAEAARSAAGQLGLKNVEIRCQDLRDFGKVEASAPPRSGWKRAGRSEPAAPSAPEAFDYIIAYGLYSWVSAEVRDALLELCSRRLAPGGVALISYNVLPGWQAQATIRELMIEHIWGAGREAGNPPPVSAEQVVAGAREVLDYLAGAGPAVAAPAALLKETAELLRRLPDANLLHDHLGPINQPVYFGHFAAQATAKGMRYLGDAGAQAPEPPGNAEALNGKPGKTLHEIASDPLSVEAFVDSWSNRPFRLSLLCRADAPPRAIVEAGQPGEKGAVPFAPNARHVRRLFVGSPLRPTGSEPEFGMPVPEIFVMPGGATATVSDPLTRSALFCLAEAWPGRLRFDALLDAAWRRMGLAGGAAETGADRLGAALLHGYLGGIVEFSVADVRCTARLTRRPVARALSRFQAETDDTVTNLRHENVQLNATARSLLRLLDGSRDFAGLCADMERIVVENARNMDPTLTLNESERQQIAQALQKDLRRFAEDGLLVG